MIQTLSHLRLLAFFAVALAGNLLAPLWAEPLAGKLSQEVEITAVSAQGESPHYQGQVQLLNLLGLHIDEPSLLAGLQIYWQPQISSKTEKGSRNNDVASLVIYSDLKNNGEELNANRIATRIISCTNPSQFYLPLHTTSLSAPKRGFSSFEILDVKLQQFPIYLSILPFSQDGTTVFVYDIVPVYREESILSFAFSLAGNPISEAELQKISAQLQLEIDMLPFPWKLGEELQLESGQHNIELKHPDYYAKEKIELKPGEKRLLQVDLQLSLAQLQIEVPEDADVLIDGIPLQQGMRRDTPSWPGASLSTAKQYHSKLTRSLYTIPIKPGKHFLFINYEDRTWQQEMYLEAGTNRKIRLDWSLTED